MINNAVFLLLSPFSVEATFPIIPLVGMRTKQVPLRLYEINGQTFTCKRVQVRQRAH